jgi:FkbM family methyltransferase
MKEKTLKLWYRDDGVNDYLHNHSLSKNSLVVDIGCYKGKWIKKMSDTYGCTCIGVEPIEEYAAEASKIEFNSDVTIHNFGITSQNDCEHSISVTEDASSIFILTEDLKKNKIKLKNAKTFFESIDRRIDVLQINAEGIEYELVPYIVKNNIIDKVDFIQIQFHDFYPSSDTLMIDCIKMIEDVGFNTKFQYPFVWYGAQKQRINNEI